MPEPLPAQGLHVQVAAANFPSRIQPWLLNAIEQLIRLGGRATILAGQSGGENYPEKVNDLGLLGKTIYMTGGEGLASFRRAGARLLAGGRDARLCRQGLGRLLRHPGLLTSREAVLSASRCLPALGLDRPDLIHAHSMVWAYHLSRLLPVIGAPLIMTFHGLTPEGVGVLAESKRRFLFDRASRLLVNTRFAQAQLESLGAPRNKITIIPQGIDLDDFIYEPSPYPQHRPVRLLTVGRLHPDKGHRYAIEGVSQLVRDGHDVEYHVVGVGPLEGQLPALAGEMGVGDRVTFLGAVDDETLRREYAEADIFVLPSLRDRVGRHEETQGVVLQEAQAMGLMVVAARAGGIPECLAEGESAMIVPDRDGAAIAAAIAELLDDPDRWPTWQAHGRRWVEERFDADKLGQRLVALYRDVSHETPGEKHAAQ
ncbi:MAG: glycosyltransferase family 4 protein [Gammaproteobacteria bacterium]